MTKDIKHNRTKPGWNTANKNFDPHIKAIRDELKQEMTESEKLLWQQIRSKKLGVKFRRQHIVDCFIPDFVALSIKLIIEVDGKIHLKRKIEDEERTQHLNMLGYKVIRFRNEEIEGNMTRVLRKIETEIEKLKEPDLS